MMIKKTLSMMTCVVCLAGPQLAHAVVLVDKDEWKATVYGFVQADAIFDTTRSVSEFVGSGPIARPGTAPGDSGRTQFSVRDSRFGFTVNKQAGDWATRALFEFDFFSGAAYPSEASTFTSSIPRVRHFNLLTEKNGWQLLAGQTWSLFGWQPTYVTTNDAIPPLPGTLFQRNVQFSVIKNMDISDTNKLSVGLAVTRPAQRDAQIPGLDAGAKWAFSGRKSALAAVQGPDVLQPMSLAVSGRTNQFEYMSPGVTNSVNRLTGYGVAVDGLIPIIASHDSIGNTLTLSGEFSTGQGIAESYVGFSGGLPAFAGSPASGNAFANTNIDAGEIGIDAGNNVQLLQTQAFYAQLQYHLPTDLPTSITVSYGQQNSNNIASLTGGGVTAANLYNRAESYDVTLMHHFTKEIRGAAEFNQDLTTYVDGTLARNNRVAVSFLYFF